MANDAERFTHGLIYDVIQVLEQHGYQRPADNDRALGQFIGDLLQLVQTFEGNPDRDPSPSADPDHPDFYLYHPDLLKHEVGYRTGKVTEKGSENITHEGNIDPAAKSDGG